MTPVMIQTDEFIIKWNEDFTKLQLRNPQGTGDDDSRYMLLKKLLDTVINPTTMGSPGPSINLMDTNVYRELQEVKSSFERLRKALEVVGVAFTAHDEVAYNMVSMVIEKMVKETPGIPDVDGAKDTASL